MKKINLEETANKLFNYVHAENLGVKKKHTLKEVFNGVTVDNFKELSKEYKKLFLFDISNCIKRMSESDIKQAERYIYINSYNFFKRIYLKLKNKKKYEYDKKTN